jgi:hypothetical protein
MGSVRQVSRTACPTKPKFYVANRSVGLASEARSKRRTLAKSEGRLRSTLVNQGGIAVASKPCDPAAMKTAVLVGSGAGSSQQTIPFVFEPALPEARKRVVVPFSGSNSRLKASDALIRAPKPVVWEWLELGFVMLFLSSAFVLILLSLAAAGNM